MYFVYGVGYVMVVGGCVIVLKVFFEMFEDCDGGVECFLVYEVCKVKNLIWYVFDGNDLIEDLEF